MQSVESRRDRDCSIDGTLTKGWQEKVYPALQVGGMWVTPRWAARAPAGGLEAAMASDQE
eukprot:7684171-Pyramimonas_sp.AAC.1